MFYAVVYISNDIKMDVVEKESKSKVNGCGEKSSENLKHDTILSLLWNAFDKVGFQVIAFVIGLVTLRLLSPNDFGLIGALAIFTALSSIFIESGFTSAMVRRPNNTDEEYVAILFFHIGLALVFYFALFFCADLIAQYYGMPELKDLSKFLFLSIIFSALSIVQNIILTKELAFKKLSLASLISAVIAGIVVIVLILLGYTYWALAWQILLQNAVKCILLWCFSSWRPKVKPQFAVIKELFAFSTPLLVNALVNTFVRYVYNPIIGRRLGEKHLGYYSEAYKFYLLPSSIITSSISGVSYPVLSKLNDQEDRQLLYLRKMVRMSAFGIFPVLFGAMACFDNIVSVVLTDKWLPIVPYFQILAIAGLVMPFQSLNSGLLTLKGYPKRSFIIESIKNALILVPIFFIHNINLLLWSFSIANILSYFVGVMFVRRVISYKAMAQIKDILPYFLISVIMAVMVYSINWLPISKLFQLVIQISVGAIFYCATCYLTGSAIARELFANIQKGIKAALPRPK